MIALTPKESALIDSYMIEVLKIPGIVLMENAAIAVSKLCGDFENVYVICGSGNNGGDGFAVARHLIMQGKNVTVALIGQQPTGDALKMAEYFLLKKQVKHLRTNEQLQSMFWEITSKDLIIDALIGTGLNRELKGLNLEAVKCINASKAYVISIDIPSGVNGVNGHIMGECVIADETVTFQYPKRGHFLYPGHDAVGKLHLAKIGIDEGCSAVENSACEVVATGMWEIPVEKRDQNTHKGSYGNLCIICGGKGYTGAGIMCVQGALKAGAGVISAVVPDSCYEIYAKRLSSAVIIPLEDSEDGRFSSIPNETVDEIFENKNCVCIGSGMGRKDEMFHTLKYMLTQKNMPMLLDADALNVLSVYPDIFSQSKCDIVITPHPKEFARLTSLSVEHIALNPVETASEFAIKHKITVLLKGPTTVVAGSNGEICLLRVGTPGMAKGGSGDVLSGVISSFMAQGLSGYNAACLGAFVCGKAGEAAAEKCGEYSMTPMDTLDEIRL